MRIRCLRFFGDIVLLPFRNLQLLNHDNDAEKYFSVQDEIYYSADSYLVLTAESISLTIKIVWVGR